MAIHVSGTPLPDLRVIDVECRRDDRGFFFESWSARDFAAAGLDIAFVQENHSRSAANVIRGLHYQDMRAPLGKLVRCTLGAILDVAVDLRVGSPTFGKYFAVELSADNMRQIYVPPGFGHGFATLTEWCEVQYKQTGYYNPATEGALIWNDPELAIAWPYRTPVLSKKDAAALTLREYSARPAFKYGETPMA